MKRIVLILCLLASGVQAQTVYSFQSDSTNNDDNTEWRTANQVILSWYASDATGTGYLDSLWVHCRRQVAGNDTLKGIICAANGTILEEGTALPMTGTGADDRYTLHFAHTTEIAANTRYWVGVVMSISGTIAIHGSAQNATDSMYASAAGDPSPVGNMQTNYRYLNDANDYRWPLYMGVFYSSDAAATTNTKRRRTLLGDE